MLQDVAAGDAIERRVGEGQPGQVGDDDSAGGRLSRCLARRNILMRQIGAGQFALGIGVFEQVSGELARPAAHVEDVPRPAEVELSARGKAARPGA